LTDSALGEWVSEQYATDVMLRLAGDPKDRKATGLRIPWLGRGAVAGQAAPVPETPHCERALDDESPVSDEKKYRSAA
jgi:hypothetical protein